MTKRDKRPLFFRTMPSNKTDKDLSTTDATTQESVQTRRRGQDDSDSELQIGHIPAIGLYRTPKKSYISKPTN